jgi:hypothetical protein
LGGTGSKNFTCQGKDKKQICPSTEGSPVKGLNMSSQYRQNSFPLPHLSLDSRLIARAGRAIFLVIALGAAACHRPADDGGLSTGAAAAHSAADSLVGMGKNAGQPPRKTDPVAAPLLDAVFNLAIVPTEPSDSQTDAILDWMQSAQRVGNLYVYAGSNVPNSPDDITSAIILNSQRNMLTYAPEVGRYFDALVTLDDKMDAMFLKVLSDPEKYSLNAAGRHGIAQGAIGTSLILSKILGAMALPGMSDDWRRGRMGALRSAAQDAAKLLSSEQRSSVRMAAETAESATTDQNLKDQLNSFSNWFLDR